MRRVNAVAGVRSESGWVRNPLVSFVRVASAFLLMICSASWASLGAETNAPPATNRVEQLSLQDVLRAYLSLQEQLRATQLAIEENRQETKQAASQNAEALTKGLLAIQETFSAQRARDWEMMQRSNNTVLVVAGTFATMGFLSMLMIAYFQWRMSKGLAKISAALPMALGLGPRAALGPADPRQLHLPGVVESQEGSRHAPDPGPPPALKRREGVALPVANLLLPDGGPASHKRQIRALRTAVIVGLICAAALALLLYLLTYGKLGFGPLHAVFKI